MHVHVKMKMKIPVELFSLMIRSTGCRIDLMETLWLLQCRNATAVTKDWNSPDLAIRCISQVLNLVFMPVGINVCK